MTTKTVTLNCKIMDELNGASWSDTMRVEVTADDDAEPEAVAKLVNLATYLEVTGELADPGAEGKVERALGTLYNGVCWVAGQDGACVIEWHAA